MNRREELDSLEGTKNRLLATLNHDIIAAEKAVKKMAYDEKAVKAYHSKLKDFKIRFLKPDEEEGIPDYMAIIKEQALGQNKSVNEYVLDLIEKDIRENGQKIADFHIIRGETEKRAK